MHSTNPLERLNKEVKRRADVVGIFPNEDSIARLIAVLLEANDAWQLQHRYMQVVRRVARRQADFGIAHAPIKDKTLVAEVLSRSNVICVVRTVLRRYSTLKSRFTVDGELRRVCVEARLSGDFHFAPLTILDDFLEFILRQPSVPLRGMTP